MRSLHHITFLNGKKFIKHDVNINVTREKIKKLCKLFRNVNAHVIHVPTDKRIESNNINIDNVLILMKSHKEGRNTVYIDQYDTYWIIRKGVTNNHLNEIKKDFEFLKMFGLLHRIAIPMYGRYYALDKDDNNKIKSSISLLYRIGTKATLKVLWS